MEAYDGDNPELARLNSEVLVDTDSFEAWEKLVRTAEQSEGGISRNSSPQSIAAVREIYDRFLFKFPLFFGYWKKYADLEFAIAGTEAAELVYERGVACVGNCVDLWAHYCTFKADTCHDPEATRELFERAAGSCGLDFLSHPFWDRYLEFEERIEAQDNIFALLKRIVRLPIHQYARYFERFRQQLPLRPPQDSMPAETFAQMKAEIEMEASQTGDDAAEIERKLRARIDQYHMDVFNRVQAETTKRWTFESEIKRPYFHVTELDDNQLSNWRRYLDFEEAEGDNTRTAFLYERCLVAAAYYDEFWLRYARWMSAQAGKSEEVRNIYNRASCVFAPVARPAIRLQWALFEESQGRAAVAHDIYAAILSQLAGHVDTTVAWAHSLRRLQGIAAATDLLKSRISEHAQEYSRTDLPLLLAAWAGILCRNGRDAAAGREVLKQHVDAYLDCRSYWQGALDYEIEQPDDDDGEQLAKVKGVFEDIRNKSQLSDEVKRELSRGYMQYLLHRGGREAASESVALDREINK